MANSYFQFKQFTVQQDKCAMKVTTDACLFGAWVAERINNVAHPGSFGKQLIINNCLDTGTGTGLLSLMLAQKKPALQTDAIEIDEAAAEQAKKNVDSSPWSKRIKVVHADAKKFDYQKKYDVIISNPPFYENELKAEDEKRNLAHHSEQLLFPELLNIIRENLQPNGSFYLLLPYKRHDEIKKLLTRSELAVRQLVFVRQSVNHDYFRIMIAGMLKSDKTTEIIIEEIAITDEKQQYTSSFTKLLKDYYLRL